MTLMNDLSTAKTEEEVKDAYIKAIGLKSPGKGKVDIQAPNMWFEAKEAPTAANAMFAQLLWYVRDARSKGEHIPAFLSVIDREKAAIMETELAFPVLEDQEINWPQSASAVDKKVVSQVAPHIDGAFNSYNIASQETEFLTAIKSALKDGKIIRTPITRDNLRQVFNKWVEMIGREMAVPHESDYASLFFADIMHDGFKEAMSGLSARLLQNAGKPLFLMKDGRTFEPASLRGYRNFWRIYDRPPEVGDRHYLLERRDILLPFDEQKFKGAFYTPPHIVDKAYDLLTQALGKGWQEDYIIWDMCCGVGNLELSHIVPRNLYMSTLDQEDIDGMKSRGTFAGATMFQYDYLNDDVNDFGEIDYSLTNKVPAVLRQALEDAKAGKEGTKKILVLINPPYAEAKSGLNNADKNRVANTKISYGMSDLGYAARELFVQFVHRIMTELPTAKLAMFSTLKYINAPNFEAFRNKWKAAYLDGFIVHSKSFDSLKGNFPIGFLIWDLNDDKPTESIKAAILEKGGTLIGQKTFFNVPNKRFLSNWLPRLKTTSQNIPLKNAITPQLSHAKVTAWHSGSIGYLLANGNDFQQSGTLTALLSSVFSAGNGFYVTPENIDQAAVIFAVRMLIPHTWQNHNDQFLQPSSLLTDEFKSDCLVWMLFAGKNLSAGACGLEWNDRTWSLTNHFIPFTEVEVGASGRFESDFMVRHMKDMVLSTEAQTVLDEGRKLWQRFHAINFPRKIRDEYKLDQTDGSRKSDAGWYQIRKSLEANSENDPVDFTASDAAHFALGNKLRPMVFEFGFLPE